MGQDTPLLSDPLCLFRDKLDLTAGAEVLRFSSTLSLVLLSVCFPHPCMETLASEKGIAEARGPMQALSPCQLQRSKLFLMLRLCCF